MARQKVLRKDMPTGVRPEALGLLKLHGASNGVSASTGLVSTGVAPLVSNSNPIHSAEHLARVFGTEEDPVNCSFYFKVGACRLGDQCPKKHNYPFESQTLLLSNMYPVPQEAISIANGEYWNDTMYDRVQKHVEAFYEDVVVMFAEYGEIEEVVIVENTMECMLGNVYVKFRRESDASKALTGLAGGDYKGKRIMAEYSPVTDFREARCRGHHETTCSRRGLCKFLHYRHIPRAVKRRIARKVRGEDNNAESRSRSRMSRGKGEKGTPGEKGQGKHGQHHEEQPERRHAAPAANIEGSLSEAAPGEKGQGGQQHEEQLASGGQAEPRDTTPGACSANIEGSLTEGSLGEKGQAKLQEEQVASGGQPERRRKFTERAPAMGGQPERRRTFTEAAPAEKDQGKRGQQHEEQLALGGQPERRRTAPGPQSASAEGGLTAGAPGERGVQPESSDIMDPTSPDEQPEYDRHGRFGEAAGSRMKNGQEFDPEEHPRRRRRRHHVDPTAVDEQPEHDRRRRRREPAGSEMQNGQEVGLEECPHRMRRRDGMHATTLDEQPEHDSRRSMREVVGSEIQNRRKRDVEEPATVDEPPARDPRIAMKGVADTVVQNGQEFDPEEEPTFRSSGDVVDPTTVDEQSECDRCRDTREAADSITQTRQESEPEEFAHRRRRRRDTMEQTRLEEQPDCDRRRHSREAADSRMQTRQESDPEEYAHRRRRRHTRERTRAEEQPEYEPAERPRRQRTREARMHERDLERGDRKWRRRATDMEYDGYRPRRRRHPDAEMLPERDISVDDVDL